MKVYTLLINVIFVDYLNLDFFFKYKIVKKINISIKIGVTKNNNTL